MSKTGEIAFSWDLNMSVLVLIAFEIVFILLWLWAIRQRNSYRSGLEDQEQATNSAKYNLAVEEKQHQELSDKYAKLEEANQENLGELEELRQYNQDRNAHVSEVYEELEQLSSNAQARLFAQSVMNWAYSNDDLEEADWEVLRQLAIEELRSFERNFSDSTQEFDTRLALDRVREVTVSILTDVIDKHLDNRAELKKMLSVRWIDETCHESEDNSPELPRVVATSPNDV